MYKWKRNACMLLKHKHDTSLFITMKTPSISTLHSSFFSSSLTHHQHQLTVATISFDASPKKSKITPRFRMIFTPLQIFPTLPHALQSPIKNLKFMTDSMPKPQVIITPEHDSQLPPTIHCTKETRWEIRVRSGGHDVGLSYTSNFPFVIVDMINLRGDHDRR